MKPHSGSKVKDGMYKGCKLKIYGSEVQIEDEINMESISLTPKYVKECKKTEKYFNVTKVKNYYHYEIIYNDGTSSYVRMSKRYHQLIDSCFKKNK